MADAIARALTGSGIPTWYDEWEIRAGDSIRQKVDAGLTECRALLVLLTKVSAEKEWVKSEIDVGFMRKFDGEQVRLIFLVVGDGVLLTPLIRTLRQIRLGALTSPDISRLVTEVAVALAPPPPPVSTSYSGLLPPRLGSLDGLASAILKVLVERAREDWPPQAVSDLATELGVADPQLMNDAVEHLVEQGYAETLDFLGTWPYQRGALYASTKACIEFAPRLLGFSVEDDIKRLVHLLASGERGWTGPQIATELGVSPLRVTLAYRVLANRRAVDVAQGMGTGYEFYALGPNHRTRALAREWT